MVKVEQVGLVPAAARRVVLYAANTYGPYRKQVEAGWLGLTGVAIPASAGHGRRRAVIRRGSGRGAEEEREGEAAAASSPHLPNIAVENPAAESFEAIPVMLRGIPANPETGSSGSEISIAAFRALTWCGCRPD